MSLSIGDNFSYLGKKFLDARQSFDTLVLMNACNDVPEGFITYCKETKKRYEYKDGAWVEYVVSSSGNSSCDGHTHDNKTVLDSITQENIDSWNSGTGMTDEERTQLANKFDDVTASTAVDEQNNELTRLTFFGNGNELKTVQFPRGSGSSSSSGGSINADDVIYYGTEEPTNDNVIWFYPDSSYQDLTINNPLIIELMSIIKDMQAQIRQLQADVEYLKTHGGGNTPIIPDPPDIPDTPDPPITTYSYLILEDGSKLLLETGEGILLEQQEQVTETAWYLILEDGSKLLLETGDAILLEEQPQIITTSYLRLEDGSRLLLETGDGILLEA